MLSLRLSDVRGLAAVVSGLGHDFFALMGLGSGLGGSSGSSGGSSESQESAAGLEVDFAAGLDGSSQSPARLLPKLCSFSSLSSLSSGSGAGGGSSTFGARPTGDGGWESSSARP